MDLVDDIIKISPNFESEESSIDSAISLLTNIVETACDHEHDLSLMRLVNLLDLYKIYLQLAGDSNSEVQSYIEDISGPSSSVLTQSLGGTRLVSFERFIRDSRLLGIAATEATRINGELVVAPAPLSVSAND